MQGAAIAETAERLARAARDAEAVGRLDAPARERLGEVLSELGKLSKGGRYFRMYPGTGKLSRHAYAKHLEHFRAGAWARERAVMGGNRTGKTEMAAYELTAHLTGLYPDWWEGRRFDRPVQAWAVGKTNETTRDIVQEKLFGPVRKDSRGQNRLSGEGMVPAERIAHQSAKFRSGFNALLNEVDVLWRDSRTERSLLTLKSYEQGRGSFEGTAKHVIWLDEEPPDDVYGECVIRTGTVDGIVYLTFTPLEGLTDVVLNFLPDELRPPDPDAGPGR